MLGVGCDIEKAERFKEVLHKPDFLSKVYSCEEIKYSMGKKDPSLYFARSFSIKESVFKALSSIGLKVPLKKIETVREGTKRPGVYLKDRCTRSKYKVFVSTSQDNGVVFSQAMVEERC